MVLYGRSGYSCTRSASLSMSERKNNVYCDVYCVDNTNADVCVYVCCVHNSDRICDTISMGGEDETKTDVNAKNNGE